MKNENLKTQFQVSIITSMNLLMCFVFMTVFRSTVQYDHLYALLPMYACMRFLCHVTLEFREKEKNRKSVARM